MNATTLATTFAVSLFGVLHFACSSTATGTGDLPSKGNENGAGTGGDAGVAPVGPPGAVSLKRVFVTSRTYAGDLRSEVKGASSGLAAADALCQRTADAAVLGGKFKAYLGDDTRASSDGLVDVGAWYRLTSSGAADPAGKVFNNKANLATTPLARVDRDEQGAQRDVWVWTGDRYGGGAAASNCANWTTSLRTEGGATGASGEVPFNRGSDTWRAGGANRCDEPAHLYCFEQ